jgi:hypothetical protein
MTFLLTLRCFVPTIEKSHETTGLGWRQKFDQPPFFGFTVVIHPVGMDQIEQVISVCNHVCTPFVVFPYPYNHQLSEL